MDLSNEFNLLVDAGLIIHPVVLILIGFICVCVILGGMLLWRRMKRLK